MANEEFIERGDLRDLPPDSHPEAQVRRRRYGASSINPPGQSPGRGQGSPVGGPVIKMGYPPPGMPGANTGQVPPPLIDGVTGQQKFNEDHPMPIQFTRAALDYIINMIRQMQVHVQQTTWIEPPFFARCIDMYSPQGGVTLPLSTPFTSIVQGPFTVPDGNVGVIVSMGQELDDPAGFDNITWRIMKNGRPEECYHDIGIQLGNIAFQSKLAVPIHLQPGDTVDFQAANTSLTTGYIAFGRIMGWYFPAEIVDNSFRSRVVN